MAGHTSNDPNVLQPHISPMSIYLKVAGALFALTFLTIIAHHFNAQLGALAAPVAFVIALVKASLVMTWFMHLKYDTKVNRIVFACGFIFLAILFFFNAFDVATRVFESSPL